MCITIGTCLTTLYVMAFTSDETASGTNTYHGIQLQYNGMEQNLTLYNRPGIQFEANKGDLWNFGLPSCTTLHEITGVSVVAKGDDGWNIKSIVTWVQDTNNMTHLLTEDFDVYRWVDGDDNLDYLHFRLTLSRDDVGSGIHSCRFADTILQS